MISEDCLNSFKLELQEHCIMHSEEEDILQWGYLQKGTFSIKEAYDIRIRRQEEEDQIWSKIWKTNPWPKVVSLCWLVAHRRILTGENLKCRGLLGPYRAQIIY